MKRSALLVALAMSFAFATTSLVSARGAAAQAPPDKGAPNVAGTWLMTLEMSMGTAAPSLELKQSGSAITGTYSGRYGSFPLEGTLKGQAIAFSFTMSAEGQAVTMSFAGEVASDGQSMKGTATLGDMGDASWTAKKQ